MTDNSDKGSETTFDEVCRFLITVGKASHSYGSTTAQIESFLSRLIVLFGYQGTFRATATEILFAFREKIDSWQHIHLEALPGAGLKVQSMDSGLPVVVGRTDVTYLGAADEHGVIEDPGGVLKVGQKLRLVPGHCDPTCNIHDWYVGVRDGKVEVVWPVSARGKSF